MSEPQRVKGRVVRSVGDYHTVALEGGGELLCRTRGRVKLGRGALMAGDLVMVRVLGDEGVVEEVFPRKTQLIRPPIANVEQAVIVMALARPRPAPQLLDRILIMAEREGLQSIIVLSKRDLAGDAEVRALADVYAAVGYTVVPTSVKTGLGLEQLRERLQGRVSVLAGPSGVGKSSLLKALLPGVELDVGQVSRKSERGRHTTRHVSLLPLHPDGWVADSPGFATLSLGTMDPRALPAYYPEYLRLADQCRFTGCLHHEEPDCAVKAALSRGELHPDRYRRYLEILSELKEAYERRY